MALKNVIGIDHAVVMVKDLDKAAETYRQLGFIISPRGTHSAHGHRQLHHHVRPRLYGAARRSGGDRAQCAGPRLRRQHGEGIERIAFTAVDSAAGAEEIRTRGLTPIGPTDFERPVTLPDGTVSAAKFRTFMWPTAEAPGGVRIFACQHKTRETVWIPELMKHANAAKRIKQALIATPEPAREASHLGKLIDREPKAKADGAVSVPSGGDRADFVYLTLDQLGKRYPGVPLAGLSERGGAALVLVSGDLAATEKALGPAAVRSGAAIVVPPTKANGTLLAFVAG